MARWKRILWFCYCNSKSIIFSTIFTQQSSWNKHHRIHFQQLWSNWNEVVHSVQHLSADWGKNKTLHLDAFPFITVIKQSRKITQEIPKQCYIVCHRTKGLCVRVCVCVCGEKVELATCSRVAAVYVSPISSRTLRGVSASCRGREQPQIQWNRPHSTHWRITQNTHTYTSRPGRVIPGLTSLLFLSLFSSCTNEFNTESDWKEQSNRRSLKPKHSKLALKIYIRDFEIENALHVIKYKAAL